jgi:hypothetical protein
MSEEEFRYKVHRLLPKQVQTLWVQKHRKEPVEAGKKQRGFGFAILKDSQMIDELLGSKQSRFVDFGDDVVLEVKRAKPEKSLNVQAAQSDASKTTRRLPIRPRSALSSPSRSSMSEASQTAPSSPCSSCPVSPMIRPRSYSGVSVTPATQVFVVAQHLGYSPVPLFPVVIPTIQASPVQPYQVPMDLSIASTAKLEGSNAAAPDFYEAYSEWLARGED